jgi:transposase
VVKEERSKKAERIPERERGREVGRCSEEAIEVDLTDQQWAILDPLIPPAKPGRRPRTSDMREVINAVLYLDRTVGQWRALPHEFPPLSTVWSSFRRWRNDGTWKRMHTAFAHSLSAGLKSQSCD